jgi:hypothetical protein
MAINPNIALAVKGLELQDPLAQYGRVAAIQGAQQQNQLAQLQMQNFQREQESTNALNRAYAEAYNAQTGEIDVNKLRGSLSAGGFGSKLPGVEKSLGELAQQRLTQEKLKGEIAAQPTTLAAAQAKLLDDKLKQSRGFLETIDPTSPGAADAYMQWHRANHADPVIGRALEARGITVDQSMARIQQLMQTPGGLARLINESKLGTEEFMKQNKPQLSTTDIGGQVVSRTFAPLTGELTTIGTQTKTPTIGERTAQGQLRVSQDRLQFDREKATQPQFNAQAGGFIAPPTKENPQGVFIPAKDIQASKDQGAAVRALRSAGYDVETGEDTISKLIAKSTSGGLQAAGAGTLAFFGKSTEGRKAIAALEGTANQIATDLAGGKLGAGISNTDRDFIVGALGDVANPSKTSDERLAGWTAAKNRMMLTGLIPPPKGAGVPTAPAAAPIKITGDADYNKLPSGSLFIGPDGQQRRKP